MPVTFSDEQFAELMGRKKSRGGKTPLDGYVRSMAGDEVLKALHGQKAQPGAVFMLAVLVIFTVFGLFTIGHMLISTWDLNIYWKNIGTGLTVVELVRRQW